MLQLPTTPQTPNQLIEYGVRLFIQAFPTIYPVALAVGIFSMLPSLSLPALSSDNLDDIVQAMLDFFPYLPFYTGIMLMLYAILFYQFSVVIRGITISYWEILRTSVEKLPFLFVATWIYAFLLGMGFFFMLIPGVVLGIALIFYMPLILFDEKGIVTSLRESFRLVWGQWLHTASVLLLAFLISSVVGQLIAMLLEMLIQATISLDEAVFLAVLKFIYILITSLLSPFLDGIILLLLHDLKLRRAITTAFLETPKNGQFNA